MTRGVRMTVILTVLLMAAGCGENTVDAGGPEDGAAVSGETEYGEGTSGGEKEEYFLSAEEDADGALMEIIYAEEKEYPALAEFLANYYQVPEENLAETRYYYNYIDLDGDGVDEIFAVVILEEEKMEVGGFPAVILKGDKESGFEVFESFAHISTPVIISYDTTNGLRDIILGTNGRDVDWDGYEICHYQPEGGYQTEANEQVDGLEIASCTQILSNNLIDDMDRGDYLTLGGGRSE